MKKQAPFKKVLCIDDCSIDRFVIHAYLTRENFTASISCCISAEDALKYLQRRAGDTEQLPEVIFLDINMPGMNGFDFLEAFKELDNTVRSYCKIVMLSSSAFPQEIEKAKSHPFVSLYLHKPLTREKLALVEKTLTEG